MQIIDASEDPAALSFAHQAAAIVHRDAGRSEESVRHGFAALRLARGVSPLRQADVMATLGVVLAYAGRTSDGLRQLDAAKGLTQAPDLPRLLLRRAHVLALVGREREARDDLAQAIIGSRALGDRLWEARALNNRVVVSIALGLVDDADEDARLAEQLFDSLGQEFEATEVLHNRAAIAMLRGDLPRALELFDRAADRYAALDRSNPGLDLDRVEALLTAGLYDEAETVAREGLSRLDLAPVKRAELMLAQARAALATGKATLAGERASEAARLFTDQLRDAWVDRARLLELRAGFVSGHPETAPWQLTGGEAAPSEPEPPRDVELLADARALITSMRHTALTELPIALVLHGRVAQHLGRDEEASASLSEAAALRRVGPPLTRAAGWLAAALLADQAGDRRSLYAACRHGLDAVDEHRAILGDLELRALASGHGIEFAQLALASAVRSGRARDLWWWAERWRASALNAAYTRPDDPVLRIEVAALRDVTRRIDSLAEDDPTGSTLHTERTRLEASIRRAHRRLRAEGTEGFGRPAGLDIGRVVDELGDGVLVTLINDRGSLHLVLVCQRRVRHLEIGSVAAAAQEADFARFALRRAASGRLVNLASTAARLESALLGGHATTLRRLIGDPDRPVIVVPPAGLLTAPWGLLPLFAESPLSVSPSVTQWLKARRSGRDRRSEHVSLITGPGLSTRESEVTNLSPIHHGALVLPAERATVSAALEILDGAALAHIAAHGTFRAEAPLFSSLQLADGPLTVHDLEELRRPPRSIILSACDSGGAAPIGPHEALGLVSALLGMGTSDVLASVVPVNDHATLGVMAQVHAVAGRGGTLSEGWLAARKGAMGDDLHAATAASFTSWGA
ncbi:CHAT domain-containing protein [Intrasporangium calvum]|uniref:CHAT domain-containing protein n=1 Tax=Intrasporangium calvum TaxID=53358 RepID=UPI000DF62B47|nr:CHAT domain-containing protein [Intrasporangium calvum]AXG14915.1 CHAT domain-containing protein [Intrasporangium calvum]